MVASKASVEGSVANKRSERFTAAG
jgi:hypothetical protein